MGCMESRLERDVQTNIFHVVNAHERGQRQRSARLEVTDSYLILHQRDRAPINWPLRCLRRYGFDAEQFSFESGRRCPTGPGVYNFKCRRAEALFNLLQLQIQNIAEDATSRDMGSLPPSSDMRDSSRTNGRTTTAIDDQGYLQTFPPRPLIRPPNIHFGGSIRANGGMGGIGVFSNIVGGIAGIRSSGPPSAPTSPSPIGVFGGSDSAETLAARSEERDDPRPPSTPGTDPLPRETPATTTEISQNILINYTDRVATYLNNSERPSSYSSSGSDRAGSLANYGDRAQSYVSRSDHPLSHVKVDPPKSSLGLSGNFPNLDDRSRCRHHLYINVDTDLRRERNHVYANLGLDKDIPVVPPRTPLIPGSGGSGSSHSGTTTTTDTDQQNSQINYIKVALDRGSDSSLTAPLSPLSSGASVVSEYPRGITGSSNMSTRGYATIDFEKTEALINTAKDAATWKSRSDGLRRTRHNSTFAPIPPLGRHNSTLSD